MNAALRAFLSLLPQSPGRSPIPEQGAGPAGLAPRWLDGKVPAEEPAPFGLWLEVPPRGRHRAT